MFYLMMAFLIVGFIIAECILPSERSQEANAKYEEIRDNIYMLTDYKNQYGLEDILAFKAGYNISDSEVSTVGTSGNNSVMDNAGYYKNMKTII